MSFPTLRLTFALAALVGACTPKKPPTPPEESGPVACTKEAKICPDGSTVGRTGPNCEFAECPAAAEPTDEAAPADPAAPPA